MAEISQHNFFWEERRISHDRRKRPTHSLHHKGITGRRARLRRNTDSDQIGTDSIDKSAWLASLAIILLSVLDFILTSIIINAGGVELNVLMEQVIKQGSALFFIAKYSLTALAVLILLSHQHRYFLQTIKVKTILFVILFAYLCLFIHEIRLIALIYQ